MARNYGTEMRWEDMAGNYTKQADDTPEPAFEQVGMGDKAVKFDGDKLRYDLLPPEALEELVRVYTIGAKKYAPRNWEKGMSWGRIFGAMMRHSWAWWRGEKLDPKDGQHHLASVAWCALALMTYEIRKIGTDDRSA